MNKVSTRINLLTAIGAMGDDDYFIINISGVDYKIKKSNLGISGGAQEFMREAYDCRFPQTNPAPETVVIGGVNGVEKSVREFSASIDQGALDTHYAPSVITATSLTVTLRFLITGAMPPTVTFKLDVSMWNAGDKDNFDDAPTVVSVSTNVGTNHGYATGDYVDVDFVFDIATSNITANDTLDFKYERDTTDTLAVTALLTEIKGVWS